MRLKIYYKHLHIRITGNKKKEFATDFLRLRHANGEISGKGRDRGKAKRNRVGEIKREMSEASSETN